MSKYVNYVKVCVDCDIACEQILNCAKVYVNCVKVCSLCQSECELCHSL